MTLRDRAKLAKLRLDLKSAIGASRKAHGTWVKWHATKDWRRRHGSYVAWQKSVAAIEPIKAQIKAIEAKYALGFTTCSMPLAQAVAIWEGGRSGDGLFHAYQDAVGVWTIGYGHTAADGTPVPHAGSAPLTGLEATALLLHDLNTFYAPAVAKALKGYGLKATQKEFDGETSFSYNLGPGYFSPAHDVGQAMQAHNWTLVAADMLHYNHAGGQVLDGLTRRRKWESQLVLGGTYTVT